MPFLNSDDGFDDERLIRYLVGSLDDGETERFDELSIADESFATRLRAVEDDLVDAYVKGELAADIRDRFESRYLSAQAGRDKIRFAEALLVHQRKGSAFGADQGDSRPVKGSAPGARAVVRWGPLWAISAAATLVLAVGSYWFVGLSRVEAPPQPVDRPPAVEATQPSTPAGQRPPDALL